ncbi:MAG: SCP2 sterol-binding domain-containing protein [Anaerolineae bacterium]|nr:SCP2 sterol-binding domain-containing protein [Anaerolineae bacterium]
MPTASNVKEIFDNMCSQFRADKAQGDNATIQFELSGDSGGKWWAQVNNGTCAVGEGDAPAAPDMTLTAADSDYLAMVNGTLSPMTAFMQGKVKVKGSMGLALKLQNWFGLGS